MLVINMGLWGLLIIFCDIGSTFIGTTVAMTALALPPGPPQVDGYFDYKEDEDGNMSCHSFNEEVTLRLSICGKTVARGKATVMNYTGPVSFWFNKCEFICWASLGGFEVRSPAWLISVEYRPRLHTICGPECMVKLENGRIKIPLMANPKPTITDWLLNSEAVNSSIVLVIPKVEEESYVNGQPIYWATLQLRSNDPMTRGYLQGNDLSFRASNAQGNSEPTVSIAGPAQHNHEAPFMSTTEISLLVTFVFLVIAAFVLGVGCIYRKD